MIDLQLLGGITVGGPDLSPNARVRQRLPLALLALVAAASPNAIGRNKLMAMLWPESDLDRASNSLRQTLYWLRRELGEDVFLPESASGVQFNPASANVDLWKFREAFERNAPGDAVAAYSGPFLEGFQVRGSAEFSHWCESERAILVGKYIVALDTLARHAEQEGRHDDAVLWCRRRAAADPLSSRGALALLRALAAAGDRSGALEYAGVYENLLRVHLEVSPDPQVMEFVALLRQQQPMIDRRRPSAEVRAQSMDEVAATPTPASAMAPVIEEVVGPSPSATWKWVVAAFATLGVVAAWSAMKGPSDAPPAAGTVVVLASGVSNVGGRDPANQLIACTGRACPAGGLPQNAFVLAKHVDYTVPIAGTAFISPTPDGTTKAPPGFECCTTAVFESEFALPQNAVSARIMISVLADNQAKVAINGVEFGRQADSLASWNFAGPPATFSTTFAPARSGANRIRVTLWDGGGAMGLYYHAVVTYETAVNTGDASRSPR